MNILIIHQYFKTPEEGGGIRTWHISQAMQKAGHDVSVLSGHNELNHEVDYDGVKVRYFKIAYDNSFGFLRRIGAFLRFVQKAKTHLRKKHNYELAYVLSTPLTTGLIALHLKKRYNVPYIFEVGDLWPEVPVKLGIIKNQIAASLLYRFEMKVYQNAWKLVGLSPPIASYMQSKVSTKPVHIAPNASDTRWIGDIESVPSDFSFEKPMRICYYGALGFANEARYFLDAAKESLRRELPVEFCIMGFGAQADLIKELAISIENVKWIEPAGMEKVRKEIRKGDVTYISYRKNPVLSTGSPNKFFDGLAAGHLIVLNFGGWLEALITKNQCGFSYSPENPSEFADKLSKYLSDPDLLKSARLNSRRLAELQFEKEKIVSDLLYFIEK